MAPSQTSSHTNVPSGAVVTPFLGPKVCVQGGGGCKVQSQHGVGKLPATAPCRLAEFSLCEKHPKSEKLVLVSRPTQQANHFLELTSLAATLVCPHKCAGSNEAHEKPGELQVHNGLRRSSWSLRSVFEAINITGSFVAPSFKSQSPMSAQSTYDRGRN